MEDFPIWVLAVMFLMLVVLPILLLVLSASLILRTQRFLKGSTRVWAEVVNVHQSISIGDKHSHIHYQPVFRFTGPDGETHEAPTAMKATNRNFALGAKMEILVNPDMPEHVHLPGFWIWGMPGVILLFSLAYTGSAVFMISKI